MKRKIVFLTLCLALMLCLSAFASDAHADASGICGDDLYWYFDSYTGQLSITGSYYMYDYNSSTQPWQPYRSQIKSISLPEGMWSIGQYAFYGCTGVKSITIPYTVTHICTAAFEYCTGLTTVTFQGCVYDIDLRAFNGCSALRTVYSGTGKDMSNIGAMNGYLENAYWLSLPTTPQPTAEPTPRPTPDAPPVITTHPQDAIAAEGETAQFSTDASGMYVEYRWQYSSSADNTWEDAMGGDWSGSDTATLSVPVAASYDGYRFRCVAFNDAGSVVSNAAKLTVGQKCGRNLYYLFDDSTGALTVLGSGEMYNNHPFESISSQIRTVSLPEGLTEIGQYAFKECTSLTSINIPNSVTDISDEAFSKCSSLTSITIPNGVSYIGMNAFSYCTHLTDITIPNSVNYIEEYAFERCFSLTSVTLGNGITSLEDRVFYDCSALTSIAIPSSVTSIKAAFENCTALKKVTIPNSVTSIGYWAFLRCSSLTSVTIPSSVTSIGDSAFAGTGIKSITIPKSVTSIGKGAFSGCTGLTSINLEQGNKKFCSVNGVLFSGDKKKLLTYPAGKKGSCSIPTSVTSIDANAFAACKGLTSVTIPSSVTEIGFAAFSGCTGLTSVTIPNSITFIDQSMFYNCTGLTSITIPSSVTEIVSYAFYGCTGLKHVIYQGTKEQKKDINIGEWYNDYLTRATWHYPMEVTLNPNGGTCNTKSITVTYGNTYAILPTPAERTGYNFDGWWTTKTTGGKQVTKDTVCYAMGNFTLYARWKEAATHTVTLNANGGSCTPTSITVTYGNTYAMLPTPAERTGYNFDGWWTTKTTGGKQVTKDTVCYATGNFTLYARWKEAATHTVTLNANGGTCTPTSITVTYGNTYAMLPTPADRTGYNFDGWWTTKTTGGKQVTKDTVCYATGNFTLYARWKEAATHTVTLNANGGTCTPTSITVTYKNTYGTLPTPTRRGYKFAGWWTTKATGGKQVTKDTVCYATGNFTLYARWTALASYTVTLNPNGGSCSTPNITVYYSQTYGTLPTPTRRGYKFAGWWTTKTTGGKQVTASTVCYATGNYTIYARWTALASYTVTLNPNGGTCSTPNITVYYSQAYGTLPTPTRRGYKFAGWWTTKTTGGKQVTASTVCYATGNFTLYARWTALASYTVTLNPNGGTCDKASITVYYSQTYGTLPTPTRAGYTFAGWWTTKETGGKQVTKDTVCKATGNFTLYARWTQD